MNTNEEISNWLNDPQRDYATGAQLYAKYGKSKHLSSLFIKKSAIPSFQQKLVYELGKLQSVPAPKPVVRRKKKTATTPKPKPEPLTPEAVNKLVKRPKNRLSAEEYEKAPDAVKFLEKEWKRLFAERAHLKATLVHLPTDDDRNEAAHTIVEMSRTIQEMLDDLGYYKKFGYLPERGDDQKEFPDTLAEMVAEVPRARTRLSKAKKKYRDAKTDEDRKSANEDVKTKQEFLQQLLQKINEQENNG